MGKSEQSFAQFELQMIDFFRFLVFSRIYIWKNLNNHLPKSRAPDDRLFSFFRVGVSVEVSDSVEVSCEGRRDLLIRRCKILI